MKGIVLTVGLIALTVGVSMGLMFYISHEQFRLNTVSALKQALNETLIDLGEMDPSEREEAALGLFVEHFTLRLDSGVRVTVDLMGFNSDPLAMRIRIKATDQRALFDLRITTEETMIEVDYENQ